MLRDRRSDWLTGPIFDKQPLASGIDLEKDIFTIWRKTHVDRTIDEAEHSHECT